MGDNLVIIPALTDTSHLCRWWEYVTSTRKKIPDYDIVLVWGGFSFETCLIP